MVKSKTIAVLALIVFDKEVEELTDDGELFDNISTAIHSGVDGVFGDAQVDFITACHWPDHVAPDIKEMDPGPEKDALEQLSRENEESKTVKKPELKVVWRREDGEGGKDKAVELPGRFPWK